MKLLETLPKINCNEDNLKVTMDRGYGKKMFVENILQRDFTLITVANTVGSRHPFYLVEEINKWFEQKENFLIKKIEADDDLKNKEKVFVKKG